MYDGPICLGLTPESTNEEIKAAAFDFVHSIGWMFFATTAVDGKTPANRGLEVHYLDHEKNLYIGASRGKHFYDEIERNPMVCGMVSNTIAIRISAKLVKVDDEAIRARYWELNRGTELMYHKDLSNFQVYRLDQGDGEVFHVYKDDAIARVRFSFGGDTVRPWTYCVGNACTGCGVCVEKCMMDTIQMRGDKAYIEHYGCNECGICYNACPSGVITKTEFVEPAAVQ